MRRHVEARERIHCARRAVKSGVRAGNRRREDDEGKERGKPRHAVVCERRREDALIESRLIPGQDGDEQRDRDDVERDDAPRHVAHGDRDALLRVLALARRESDDLRALEVHEDDDHREDDGPVAVRRKAAAAEQHARADVALIADESEADEPRHDAERDKRHDLEQGEPKLALTELVHMEQIDDGHEQAEEHRPPELADGRYEIAHDDARGNHLRRHIGHPGNPVGPANAAGPGRGDILLGIHDEGARDRLLHRELREAEHDTEHDDAPEQIGEDRGRARLLEDIARAEEITAADDTSEGDELQVTVLETPVHLVFIHGACNTTFPRCTDSPAGYSAHLDSAPFVHQAFQTRRAHVRFFPDVS